MSLPPRKIGNALVHPVGFGVMGISKFYGKVGTDEERFEVQYTIILGLGRVIND